MGTHPIFESDFDCLTEMKLSLLLLGLSQAQELALTIKDEFYTQLAERRVKVEEGGKLEHDSCQTANKWTLLKLGNQANAEVLKPTSETETDARYTLKNNVLTVNGNKKDRSMMGYVACSQDSNVLGLFQITGEPLFESLANSLTNLDGDENKRMDCAVSGFPLPVISWRFQAIDKDESPVQCAEGVCSPCLDEDKCNPEVETGDFYNKNSSSIFDVPVINSAVQVRYSLNAPDQCPMVSADVSDSEGCKIAADQAALDGLNENEKQKSQLFFAEIAYIQRGKYICMATQEFKYGGAKIENPKSFIWRVKDPTAALWPFLALVAEVIIVVCIILYYEKASSAKKDAAEADQDEEGQFIAKKEEK